MNKKNITFSYIKFSTSACIIAISLLFVSCAKELDSESFVNLEQEFDLYITQELSDLGGLASIELITTQELDCSNYIIPYQVNNRSSDVSINLGKVVLESSCIPEAKRVSQVIDLDIYDKEKSISISLQGAIKNSGKIEASQDEISISLTSNHGIKINKAKINRVQKGMIWGEFSADHPETSSAITDYLFSIKEEQIVKSGDYGLFYVKNDSGLQLYDSGLYDPSFFIFHTISSRSEIAAKINDIKENDPSLVFNMTIYDGSTINVE